MCISEKGDYVFQPEDKTESYHSWYEFDEQLKQYIDSVGSIQGYNGSYYIDRIILDFDKKALDNDQLLESFKYFVNQRLMNDIGIPSDTQNANFGLRNIASTSKTKIRPNLAFFNSRLILPLKIFDSSFQLVIFTPLGSRDLVLSIYLLTVSEVCIAF